MNLKKRERLVIDMIYDYEMPERECLKIEQRSKGISIQQLNLLTLCST
jgi:hypothetical protein